MKPESLNALLIDRELGELPPEAIELLDTWLAEHPELAGDIRPIRRTLETTRAAIRCFPELARPEANVIRLPAFRSRLVPLALAASVFLLLGGTVWLGFRAGRESAQKTAVRNHGEPFSAQPVNRVTAHGPWARYALASDPRGGLTVVRRDPNPQP